MYAICTILKFEHDYINQFIEHHLNIGFDSFYIIIDNLDFKQAEYINVIHDKFFKYIKLFNLDKSFDEQLYINLKINKCSTHSYWIKYFNQIVLPEVKEDWLLMIGGDSFLYLDGKNINEYMNNILTVNNNIFQVAFPWLAGYNLDNKPIDNFCNEINKLHFQYHNHTYGMGKVSNIEYLDESSHYFVPKTREQIIYIPENIILNMGKQINAFDIFKNNKFNINENSNVFALHVQLRNYDEIIIKDLYSWNMCNDDRRSLLNSLLTQNNTSNFISNTKAFRLNYILNNSCTKIKEKQLNVANNNFINLNKYNKTVIMELLKSINIKYEQYELFINTLIASRYNK